MERHDRAEEHAMKYLVLVYGNKNFWKSFSPEEFAEIVAGHDAFFMEARRTGEYVSGEGLAYEDEAKVVRVTNGKMHVTDDPYLESKEHLASFYIVDCASMERALELAAILPTAKMNGVEVWPVDADGER
jgi:hypothetical protein